MAESTSAAHRIVFADIDWQAGGDDFRQKVAIQGKRRTRIVNFGLGHCEPDWCTAGHVGYVIEGEMEIEFTDQVMTLMTGDAFVIAEGPENRHRHRRTLSPTTLFLVEDLPPNPSSP